MRGGRAGLAVPLAPVAASPGSYFFGVLPIHRAVRAASRPPHALFFAGVSCCYSRLGHRVVTASRPIPPDARGASHPPRRAERPVRSRGRRRPHLERPCRPRRDLGGRGEVDLALQISLAAAGRPGDVGQALSGRWLDVRAGPLQPLTVAVMRTDVVPLKEVPRLWSGRRQRRPSPRSPGVPSRANRGCPSGRPTRRPQGPGHPACGSGVPRVRAMTRRSC